MNSFDIFKTINIKLISELFDTVSILPKLLKLMKKETILASVY